MPWIPVLVSAAGQRAGLSVEEWQQASIDLACSHAKRWLAAKVRFRLTVKPEEQSALTRLLTKCGR